MVSEFDISALRKDTEAIIDINPYDVEITRREETEDGYGNIKKIDTVLPKQRMRIAELSHNETERLMQEGVFKNHGVNITALHDADIKKAISLRFWGTGIRLYLCGQLQSADTKKKTDTSCRDTQKNSRRKANGRA
ncbi:hypothetical protein TPHV1_10213 [Treponema phagedenis]|uniref:Uncharacterized protein n=1 Tax=Treponema phagedenis TaxID=162 RepID=A0A0B7GUC0_TREPH|nr:hypothetical protein [Treponema phagedenis]CEM60545.1 hypothetical protein TPHV1_10213 [Treponema phagedenis]